MSKQKRIEMISRLENELRVLKASQISTVCEAYRNIDNGGQSRYMASAVTVTIKNINLRNNVVVEEVAISDGLSKATIEALKDDIKRTYAGKYIGNFNKLEDLL